MKSMLIKTNNRGHMPRFVSFGRPDRPQDKSIAVIVNRPRNYKRKGPFSSVVQRPQSIKNWQGIKERLQSKLKVGVSIEPDVAKIIKRCQINSSIRLDCLIKSSPRLQFEISTEMLHNSGMNRMHSSKLKTCK